MQSIAPAPTGVPIVARYNELDRVVEKLDRGVARATDWVGEHAPGVERVLFGTVVFACTTAAAALAGTIAAGFGPPGPAIGDGVAACILGPTAAGGASFLVTMPFFAALDRAAQRRNVDPEQVAALRRDVQPTSELDRAGLAIAAKSWADALDARRAKGVELRSYLFDLEDRCRIRNRRRQSDGDAPICRTQCDGGPNSGSLDAQP